MVAILPSLHKPSKTSLTRSPKQLAGVDGPKVLLCLVSPQRGPCSPTRGSRRNENFARIVPPLTCPSVFICSFIYAPSKKDLRWNFSSKTTINVFRWERRPPPNKGNWYWGCLGLLQQKRLPEGSFVGGLLPPSRRRDSRTGDVGHAKAPRHKTISVLFWFFVCFLNLRL